MDDITINKIKEVSGIVDVIGDFYELRRHGQTHTCLCPFHEDRHLGSFQISPRKNIYKCFSCGAQGGPIDFLMNHEKLTFLDAVRWLGQKYSIATDEEAVKNNRIIKPAEPRKLASPLPTLYLDIDKYMMTRLYTENNVLCRWLKSLPWQQSQKARIDTVLKNYAVGTAKDSRTIFYQLDEIGRLHTGKIMRYKDDGHRDKESHPTWVHSVLFQAEIFDFDEWEVETCLFGLHLLDFAKPKTVNIVESEKTALICSIAYGDMEKNLWLATGGMSNLKKEKLQAIIDRDIPIVLYPDRDGIEEWKARAKEIKYRKMTVNSDFIKKNWREEDGEKADIADIIVRMIKPKIEKAEEQCPSLAILREKFDVELITINKDNEER